MAFERMVKRQIQKLEEPALQRLSRISFTCGFERCGQPWTTMDNLKTSVLWVPLHLLTMSSFFHKL